MDNNQNTSKTNDVNSSQQESVGPTPAAPRQSPMTNIKQSFEKAKTSPLLKQASSKFDAFPSQQKRLLKIAGGVFVFTIIILILGSIVKSLKFSKPVSTPTPTPKLGTPLPTPQGIGIPSVYATDSGVLKIESDVKVLENKLGGTDLDESNLKPPDINFYVRFTQ